METDLSGSNVRTQENDLEHDVENQMNGIIAENEVDDEISVVSVSQVIPMKDSQSDTTSLNTIYVDNSLDESQNIMYNINDEIESNYHNTGHWLPGRILKINDNNSYNVEYNNKEIDNNVSKSNIRKNHTPILKSRLFSNVEFNKLHNDFNNYSDNGIINRENLNALLIQNDYHSINFYKDIFLEEYLHNLGNCYTFIDYYTIINHLRNLKQIKTEKLIEMSADTAQDAIKRKIMDMNLRNVYEEVEREKQYMNINKMRYDITKEKELLDAKQKYENEVKLYSKDLYGITWKGCISNMFKCFMNESLIKDFDKIYEIIKELPTLNNYEKNLILVRFQTISLYCIKHYNTISKWYNSTQLFIIACSIVNPALLSINSNKENLHYYTIFWSVWISQLLVSLTTSYISFFKWDKKYFLFNGYKTKINQEIWLFIELSGSHYKNDQILDNNHSKQLNKFLNRLENLYKKLKMSEFEIETTNNEEEGNKENPNKQLLEDLNRQNRAQLEEEEQDKKQKKRLKEAVTRVETEI